MHSEYYQSIVLFTFPHLTCLLFISRMSLIYISCCCKTSLVQFLEQPQTPIIGPKTFQTTVAIKNVTRRQLLNALIICAEHSHTKVKTNLPILDVFIVCKTRQNATCMNQTTTTRWRLSYRWEWLLTLNSRKPWSCDQIIQTVVTVQ